MVFMTIENVRQEIENIDRELVELIAKRVEFADDILKYKHQANLPINDDTQNNVVIDRAVSIATERGLDSTVVKQIFNLLIQMNIERQHELSGEGNLP